MGGGSTLDNSKNILITEKIRKEERMRWNHAATHQAIQNLTTMRARSTALHTPRVPIPSPRVSAATRFLEEKTGLAPSTSDIQDNVLSARERPPSGDTRGFHDERRPSTRDARCQSEDPRPSTRDVLYHGISHEGNGRYRYLRERKKYGVLERYGMPLTVMQAYGVGDGARTQDPSKYIASPNCKKPTIQKSFFRTMGVDTYKGLPGL
eukprot:TRINITY_DN50303_c0_g1_i1.p2 TRINITY_DN50303_c0_g1~~TRINITY_DN50303_c0_g1_i1.p2  ORF type:complete len:208 (-),score=28.38 TRINITY_DN50303_c0_g1_i1:54-677(-)